MIELGTGAGAAADTGAAPADLIKDGTDATFRADVMEASREVPVIVDFWAEWCGPCKSLGPVLEKAVIAAKGKVKLVKIDVDRNQMIASQLRVQSIPAVFAFLDGQPVDGFMGAVTPAEIQSFVDRLIEAGGAGGIEEALDAADQMLEEGAAPDAAQTYAAILGEDPENARAMGGMIRAALATGQIDQARTMLEGTPEKLQNDPAIAAARSAIELAEMAAGAGELGELNARLEANPDDHQARFDLATALVAQNDMAGAIDALLELFRRDAEWHEGAAKEQLFKLFDTLGPKDPLTLKGRRRLSSMIFA